MSCTSSSSSTNISIALTNLSSNTNGSAKSGSSSNSTINNDHTEIELENSPMLPSAGASAVPGPGLPEPGSSHSYTVVNSVSGTRTGVGAGSSSSGSVENMSTIENGDLSIFTFIVPNSSTPSSCSACSSPLSSPSTTRHNSLCNLMQHHESMIGGPPSLSYCSSGSYGRKYSLPTSCTCAKTSYIGNGGGTFNGTHSATIFHSNGAELGAGGRTAPSLGLYTNGYGRRGRNSDGGSPGLSNFSLDSLRLENPYHKHSTQHSPFCQHSHQQQLHRSCQHQHRCEECETSKPTSPFLSHRNQHQHRYSSILNDRNYIRSLSRSGDDLLLKSLEKGVLFPVVHWSSKCNENLTHHHNQFGPSVAYNQGIYKELKRVIPSDNWLNRERIPRVTAVPNSSPPSTSRRSTWLIIGYKSLEKTLDSTLEATWKDWTGVRHIYINLRHDFEICKISFLHRVYPQDNLDLFMYIVLMEIGNVDEKNTIWLLDFVQRMRVERMKGFITVYSEVEHEISSIDDEYAKYVNQDKQKNFGLSLLSTLPSPWSPPPVRYNTTSIWNKGKINGATNGSGNMSTSSGVSTPPPISAVDSTKYGLKCDRPKSPISAHSSTMDEVTLSLADHNAEINGNLRVIEKLLEEIHRQPIGDYF